MHIQSVTRGSHAHAEFTIMKDRAEFNGSSKQKTDSGMQSKCSKKCKECDRIQKLRTGTTCPKKENRTEQKKKRRYAVEGGLWRWSRISMILPGIQHHVALPCIKPDCLLLVPLQWMTTTETAGSSSSISSAPHVTLIHSKQEFHANYPIMLSAIIRGGCD